MGEGGRGYRRMEADLVQSPVPPREQSHPSGWLQGDRALRVWSLGEGGGRRQTDH